MYRAKVLSTQKELLERDLNAFLNDLQLAYNHKYRIVDVKLLSMEGIRANCLVLVLYKLEA